MKSETSWKNIAKELEEVLGNTNYQNELKQKAKQRKKMIKYSIIGAIVLGSCLLWFMGARWVYRKATKADTKDQREQLYAECGCNSVDDCLSKDSTASARKLLFSPLENNFATDIDLLKIIEKEGAININKENFEAGWAQINAEKLESIYESRLEAIKYKYLKEVVDFYLEAGNKKLAKKWALKGAPDLNEDGYTENETHNFDPKKTQRKLLLKRIAEFEG
jgi:hypothetical protein